jgi:RNA polymerase sigma factor (sigma-70 family)
MARRPQPGTMDATEQELVVRVIRGEEDAFRLLWEAYMAPVHPWLVRRIGVSRDHADDILQQLFERLSRYNWSALRHWRGENLRGYLRSIAGNLVQDDFRRAVRERILGDPPDDPEQPSEPGPEDERFRAEIRQALDDCAARLQGRDRKLLELFHIRGLPYRKIAEMLRLSVSAVGVALGRAEQRMRRCLETHHSEIAFLKGLV